MVEILGEKDICRKCGKCCRLITSQKSYMELSADAKNGDSVAVNFLKLFLPYLSEKEAAQIDVDVVNSLILANKRIYGEDSQTYFYYCRYIQADNSCGVYDMRPKLCRHYPKNEFVPLPLDCSYEGYSFIALEKVKAKVRKAKEQLLDIKVARLEAMNRGEIEKLNRLEKKLNEFIASYSAYGANDW